MKTKQNQKKKKINLKIKRIFLLLFSIGIIGLSSGLFLLYGPYTWVRETLITTAMTTMSHQYLARWFFSDEYINKVLVSNALIEPEGETNPDIIEMPDFENDKKYASKYEKDIFEGVNENTIYKIIDVEGKGYKGYIVAIYKPEKVKLAVSSKLGTEGETVKTMAQKNNALITMNGGGFFDPTWNGNGGIPHGTVIKDGRIIYDYVDAQVGGGFIGFDKDNKLILGRMTKEQAIAKGMRDAIEFGPYLIINGKAAFSDGDGGWGIAPRSAIGQRQDGIVLFAVIDGRSTSSLGIDMVGLTKLMQNYGAINAANLDGGTSSALLEGQELVNHPRSTMNGPSGVLRRIATAWIVVE